MTPTFHFAKQLGEKSPYTLYTPYSEKMKAGFLNLYLNVKVSQLFQYNSFDSPQKLNDQSIAAKL
jgi:hypothetical protein